MVPRAAGIQEASFLGGARDPSAFHSAIVYVGFFTEDFANILVSVYRTAILEHTIQGFVRHAPETSAHMLRCAVGV